jgi:GNAT superfamily N-acetyltransferase
MRIRPRQVVDLGACVQLLAAVHAADGYPVNLPEDPATFLASPELLGAWVAEEEGSGELLGHVALRPRTSEAVMERAVAASGMEAGRLAVVARLLVAPAARRRGVGRELLEVACRRAAELGRHPVLDVVTDHAAAVALYDRAGWRRAGQVRVTFANGQTVDELVFIGPGPSRRGDIAPDSLG